MNILFYGNCHFAIYFYLFEIYFDNHNINYIANFPIDNDNYIFKKDDIQLFKNADLLIYQPMNNKYNSQKCISYILKIIKNNCKLIKVAFYRFNGFYTNYIKKFDKERNIKYINNVNYNYYNFTNDFKEACIKLKNLDDNESDIKIYDYFEKNYKSFKLFTDPRHPTPLFFYIIFINICKHKYINVNIKFCNEKLKNLEYVYKIQKYDKFSININSNISSFLNLKYI